MSTTAFASFSPAHEGGSFSEQTCLKSRLDANVEILDDFNTSTDFFVTIFQTPMDEDCWLAVSDEGIAVLDMESMSPSSFYPYDSVVTFGGCQDDFMLVVVNAGGKGAKGVGSSGRERRPSQRTQVSGNSAGSHTDNSYHAADTSRLLFQASKQQVTI